MPSIIIDIMISGYCRPCPRNNQLDVHHDIRRNSKCKLKLLERISRIKMITAMHPRLIANCANQFLAIKNKAFHQTIQKVLKRCSKEYIGAKNNVLIKQDRSFESIIDSNMFLRDESPSIPKSSATESNTMSFFSADRRPIRQKIMNYYPSTEMLSFDNQPCMNQLELSASLKNRNRTIDWEFPLDISRDSTFMRDQPSTATVFGFPGGGSQVSYSAADQVVRPDYTLETNKDSTESCKLNQNKGLLSTGNRILFFSKGEHRNRISSDQKWNDQLCSRYNFRPLHGSFEVNDTKSSLFSIIGNIFDVLLIFTVLTICYMKFNQLPDLNLKSLTTFQRTDFIAALG